MLDLTALNICRLLSQYLYHPSEHKVTNSCGLELSWAEGKRGGNILRKDSKEKVDREMTREDQN